MTSKNIFRKGIGALVIGAITIGAADSKGVQPPAATVGAVNASAAETNVETVVEEVAEADASKRKQAAVSAEVEAWKAALISALPLSPPEIEAAKSQQRDVEQASRPRDAPAQAASSAVAVSMQPGAKSPRITLLHGYVTAIEVLDSTGQPWPIVSAIQGDPKAVSVVVEGVNNTQQAQAVPAQGLIDGTVAPLSGIAVASEPMAVTGNVLTVNPIGRFSATNLIVVLVGASRPISVVLIPIEATPTTVLQDRVTLLVDGFGPAARPEPVRRYDQLDAGEDLRRVLVGQPPTAGAREILSGLPDGFRAWRNDDRQLWVRTSERVVSPAPLSAVLMGDMRAYWLPWMPAVVVSSNGRLHQIDLPADDGVAVSAVKVEDRR